MKSSITICLIIVGAVMVLGPLVLSYLYHGEPPVRRDAGIGYSWACFLAGCATITTCIFTSLGVTSESDIPVTSKTKTAY
jgi:NADH:ubiquinone oxidoreductase subunit 6 (subunit J)